MARIDNNDYVDWLNQRAMRGKSFFTNFYLRNCYDRGEHVFIIDVGISVLCMPWGSLRKAPGV